MMLARFLLACALCLCLLAATCWQQKARQPITVPKVEVPQELGRRAYEHIAKLVDMGPRNSGSVGWRHSVAYMQTELRKLGLQVRVDRWRDSIEGVEFANVIATIPGQHKDRLVIGAHHDSKCCSGHPDAAHNFEFVGANDSGSGVGLLLAMAAYLKDSKPKATIELVFFDGEESLSWQWNAHRALFGSRRYVRQSIQQLEDRPNSSRIRGLILLDMVGAKDLQIDEDLNSDATLRSIFLSAALTTGHQAYVFPHTNHVTDDHIPFVEEGIPAIDLIDLFDNPQWHTAEDNLDHISARSLQIVADLVLTALPVVERHLFPVPLGEPR